MGGLETAGSMAADHEPWPPGWVGLSLDTAVSALENGIEPWGRRPAGATDADREKGGGPLDLTTLPWMRERAQAFLRCFERARRARAFALLKKRRSIHSVSGAAT